MKKIALIGMLIALTGCGRVDTIVNNFESATGLLTRQVTLYNANGQVIKSWVTKNQIDYAGSIVKFIDAKGTNVRVSGTVIIEDIKDVPMDSQVKG